MKAITKQITIMNKLGKDLAIDIEALRKGKLDIKKADAISRMSGKAIKSIAEGVMTANHQEIQVEKIKVSKKNAQSRIENIKIQKAKLKTKGITI